MTTNPLALGNSADPLEVIDKDGRSFKGTKIQWSSGAIPVHKENGNTIAVDNPRLIMFYGSGVVAEKLPLESVNYFPYSGRDYNPEAVKGRTEDINDANQPLALPHATPKNNQNILYDGQAYFTAAKESKHVDEEIWVRSFGIEWEDAVDRFLTEHIPKDEVDQESEGMYNDQEIRDTLYSIFDNLEDFENVRSIKNYQDRVVYNIERLGLDIEDY